MSNGGGGDGGGGGGEGGAGGDAPRGLGAGIFPGIGVEGFNTLASRTGGTGSGRDNSNPADNQARPGEGGESGPGKDGPSNDAKSGKDGTFLGKSIEAMLKEGKQAPEVPASLMKENVDKTKTGNWSSHSGEDSEPDDSDPIKREELAKARRDESLENKKVEREESRDDARDRLVEGNKAGPQDSAGESVSMKEGQEKAPEGHAGQEGQKGKFLGRSWEDMVKRKGGSAASKADFLPKGGGRRLSDGKQPMEAWDKSGAEMRRMRAHAEAVSGWNSESLRTYKGRLLKGPGAAGDIARQQRKWEHPGAAA